MHAIQELANFAATHPAGSLPHSARQACAVLLTDLLAASAAGFNSNLAVAARKAAYAAYGQGPADVWLTDWTLSIVGAAMANSAAASALDLDDGHRGAAGHPGAGIIPAVLAVAQQIGASDEEIFEAIAVGYDIALRVATARPTETIETYISGRWVNFGVAAGAGRLLKLTTSQMANAIGIAGAEGPIGINEAVSTAQGNTVKECIPPAVVTGLTAAFRAQAGATGPLDLLDDEQRYTREVLTGDLGIHWWLEDCYLKPYACCRYMHAAIDAILELRRPGAPIVSLRIETFAEGLKLSNERNPAGLEGAQYSYHFSCALAAIHGARALRPVDPVYLNDPDVLELSARTVLHAHPDFATSFPKGTPCRVIMDQGEGEEVLTVLHPLGDVANPMSYDQVKEKLELLGAQVLDEDRRARILAALDKLLVTGFKPLFDSLVDGSVKAREMRLRSSATPVA
ncbi:MmgE/PrpD family protein (plasmid) [Rhizobium rhizogenes]|uniref:MmgE/PrpD family protein n=1 Tax=Rhizobium rhizogenes TaxID=359 RepID=UPI001572ED19|nr:MmgE/PrpD family protein [Rhizobium rhizogenes]NTI26622.1 MmgE/PrpD family protein [Rhizobium rhizogenes]QTG10224.1 MmgE/PrpD family protein [Rhizobium rhizogenes]